MSEKPPGYKGRIRDLGKPRLDHPDVKRPDTPAPARPRCVVSDRPADVRVNGKPYAAAHAPTDWKKK